MASSVVTATSPPTDSLFHSEASTRAAATCLGVCKAFGCFPGCSSLLLGKQNLGLTETLQYRIRPRTRKRRRFTRTPLPSRLLCPQPLVLSPTPREAAT